MPALGFSDALDHFCREQILQRPEESSTTIDFHQLLEIPHWNGKGRSDSSENLMSHLIPHVILIGRITPQYPVLPVIITGSSSPAIEILTWSLLICMSRSTMYLGLRPIVMAGPA